MWRVLALVAAAGTVTAAGGACSGVAAAAVLHRPLRVAGRVLPGSGLTLAHAPAGLRAAVRRTLSAPAAGSAFQQAELAAADGAPFHSFGWSVAISGSTAVVGAPGGLGNNFYNGAAYVFTRSGAAWTQRAELTAADGTAGDFFGGAVAISGSTVVVGAEGRNSTSGAAYVFTRSGTAWRQRAELTAADGDFFGGAVAISGSTVVVGSYGTSSGTGAAYVFTGSGAAWSQRAELTAADGTVRDFFGGAVAISGSTVVVGAPGANSDTGTAYVFTGSGTAWSQQAELTAGDGAPNDEFGFSVAISGSTVAVGAPGANANAGTAYVFTGSGTAWSEQAELPDSTAGDLFGESVAISKSVAVIGGYGASSATGAAAVFTRSGPAWTEQTALTGADVAAGDKFGYSVAISGSTVVVGAPYKNSSTGAAYAFVMASQQAAFSAPAYDNLGFSVAISGRTAVVGVEGWNSNTGAVYVFGRLGNGWSQQAVLTAADGVPGDQLGWSVAISGSTVVAGASNKNSGTGAAYVFTGSGTAWTQQAELTAAGGGPGNGFGSAVAISRSTVLVGAPDWDSSTGAAYVYTRAGKSWSQQARLTAGDAGSGDYFGNALAISGSTAIVGAPGAVDHALDGVAYVFTGSGAAWTQQVELTDPGGDNSETFGYSVAISGSTIVIGAPLANSGTGAVYVYTGSGRSWSEQAKLTAAAAAPGSDFGYSVAIASSTVVVGAPYGSLSTGAADAGAAYVFTHAGTTWSQQAELAAADAAATDAFGSSVAVSGSYAMAGAPGLLNNHANPTEAYVFANV